MSLNMMYSQKCPEMGASALQKEQVCVRTAHYLKQLLRVLPSVLYITSHPAVLGDNHAEALVVPAVVSPAVQQYLGVV